MLSNIQITAETEEKRRNVRFPRLGGEERLEYTMCSRLVSSEHLHLGQGGEGALKPRPGCWALRFGDRSPALLFSFLAVSVLPVSKACK